MCYRCRLDEGSLEVRPVFGRLADLRGREGRARLTLLGGSARQYHTVSLVHHSMTGNRWPGTLAGSRDLPRASPVSRIFISHSSANSAEAIALRDWLVSQGWSDLFLDFDPHRGIAAGQRWEQALKAAAHRCEAMIFLISKAWLASSWCTRELNLAQILNKRLFGVLVEEGLTVADLPLDVSGTWQLVDLAAGRDHQRFRVSLPITGEETYASFSRDGLARLKGGLLRAGLDANYFEWPPASDPMRAPFRGLRSLEADDAGVFFGREAPAIEAIDRLRGLREAAPPRMMVVLGASGAGKSSFLRAGLLPRLRRDSQFFLPLPVIRPERAAISGETGLVSSLVSAFETSNLKVTRGEIREAINGGADTFKLLLTRLQSANLLRLFDGSPAPEPPTFVLAIDQGEELFLAEAQGEAQPFLALLRDLLLVDGPAAIAVITIRSDNFERLLESHQLADVRKETLSLGPIPKGSYVEVIKGPIRRLEGTARALKIDESLVDALLNDVETSGAMDALPLLALTLERLYQEYGATGRLTLEHYKLLGQGKGSIEAAVERALNAANNDARIPRNRDERLVLLRRGLIPWLAGVDPDTKAPRRRVARLTEIPPEARPLIDLLVEQRLLSTDVASGTSETTIEPANAAVLRQWGLLRDWLSEDADLLKAMDDLKRAAREWHANNDDAWLSHRGRRLQEALALAQRPEFRGFCDEGDLRYLYACKDAALPRDEKGRTGSTYPTPQPKGTKIFISYRRADTKHVAGRIYDALRTEFTAEEIFFDVDTIPFGADFSNHIDRHLQSSAAVLAIIGPSWVNKNWSRSFRIPFLTKRQDDFVLMEIERAFELGIPIVPALVDDTLIPQANVLPSSIRGLPKLNAAPIRAGRDFNIDIQRVIELLKPLRKQGRG